MAETRTDWWGDLDDMQRQMEKFLEHFATQKRHPVMFSPGVWQPLVDVYETPDDVAVIAELAGVKREDVKIVLHENTLILKGERRDCRAGIRRVFQLMEVNYGPFERTVALPVSVEPETATANLENGFLVIVVKKSPAPKMRSVRVVTGEEVEGRQE